VKPTRTDPTPALPTVDRSAAGILLQTGDTFVFYLEGQDGGI
jgi:hypothetical protein